MLGDAKTLESAPVLLVADVERSANWYVDKAGFRLCELAGSPPVFAMVNRGGATIMLAHCPDGAHPNSAFVADRWDVYIFVEDIDADLARFSAGGVEIVHGPTTTPYDRIEIVVMDPEGHILCFSASN